MERLQKYLAESGIASRRTCEQYITQGLVEVNGKKVTQLGTKIDPEKDKISFKGKTVENKKQDKIYIIMNKPIRICHNNKRTIRKRQSHRPNKNKYKNNASTED